MNLSSRWPLLMSLVLHLCHGVDIYALCRDSDASQLTQLQVLCEAVRDVVHGYENGGYAGLEEGGHVYDLAKRTVGIRNRRMSEPLTSSRATRGGGYIRFGRSANPVGPSFQDYMASFGQTDKRNTGGHYMRFGRSVSVNSQDEPGHALSDLQANTEQKRSTHFANQVPSANSDADLSEEAKRFMRFGRAKDEYKRFMRFGKRFMRFGRNHEDGSQESYPYQAADKRFMRFGRDPELEETNYLLDEENLPYMTGEDEKRFMRFGRDPAVEDKDEKRFMRFGKRSDVLVDAMKRFIFGKREDSSEEDKRFMRFGKRSDSEAEKRFMRFGKKSDSEEDKRFMRFGKRSDSEEDKRYMRFGKRQDSSEEDKRYMRFGKRENSSGDKRYMRFGKRDGSEEDKRFMRFGKSLQTVSENENGSPEKRFMRFGKKSSEPDLSGEDDKRFMRFGKALPHNVPAAVNELSEDKRFMRFGKKDETQ